jgi:hypothetical protein
VKGLGGTGRNRPEQPGVWGPARRAGSSGRAGTQAGQAGQGQALISAGRDRYRKGRQPSGRTHTRTHAPGGRLRRRRSWQCWSQTHNSQTQPACEWVGGSKVARDSRQVNKCNFGSATSGMAAGVLAGCVFVGCCLESRGHALPAQRPNSSAPCHRQLSSPRLPTTHL